MILEGLKQDWEAGRAKLLKKHKTPPPEKRTTPEADFHWGGSTLEDHFDVRCWETQD